MTAMIHTRTGKNLFQFDTLSQNLHVIGLCICCHSANNSANPSSATISTQRGRLKRKVFLLLVLVIRSGSSSDSSSITCTELRLSMRSHVKSRLRTSAVLLVSRAGAAVAFLTPSPCHVSPSPSLFSITLVRLQTFNFYPNTIHSIL